MPRPLGRQTIAPILSLCILLLCRPLPGHPGHEDLLAIPLQSWQMTDHTVLSAYMLKVQEGYVWFVDESKKTTIVAMTDLDEAGRKAVNRAVTRLRIINENRARSDRLDELVPVIALAAALPEVPKPAMPTIAKPFGQFERVKTRWDDNFLYVESNGLPDHPMMKGITAWQQQVPLPQPYTGENAWRIPLVPVVAKTPASIKGRFLRGAIALAANGIPIFNPQNNRGEVSQEIGELDEWGGHCGRADDYHYHAAPLHLQKIVGKGQPIAFALDGYALYGLTEPDGAQPAGLDAFNGHTTPALGYHYHASTKYPYVNGGFHGEVTERGGQVDPQPRASPIRPDGRPLRDAKITDFQQTQPGNYALTYEVNGKKASIRYTLGEKGSAKFTFVDASGVETSETYSPGSRGSGGREREGGGPPRSAPGDNPSPRDRPEARLPEAAPGPATPAAAGKKSTGGFTLKSTEIAEDGVLPKEFTGDGASATLPLEWSGAPAGTKSYALIMHHVDPEGKTKWYWTLYNIPATAKGLAKNGKDIGTLGTNSVNNHVGYAPPHSKGPGLKTYGLTLYALSGPPKIDAAPERVSRDVLLEGMKGLILGSAEMPVTYTRSGNADAPAGDRPPPPPRGEGAGGSRPAPREQGAAPGEPQGGARKPWLQNHGVELDANKDGNITLAELTDDMNRAFAAYDRNKNGIISADELKATGDLRDGSAFAGLIFRHFADVDSNGDGSVTKDELLTAAKYIFDSADLDRDGKISKLEWESAPNAPLPIPKSRPGDPRGGRSEDTGPQYSALTAAKPSARDASTQPNVLILLVDDLGWNGVGFHNPGATTPNLNRFAKEGLELQRFYTYPVCSPARAALLTGQAPRRFGLADVIGPQQAGLPKGTVTLPSVFREAGYQTSLIGKWHLGRTNPPQQCGFDHFYGFLGPEVDYFKHTDQRGGTDWQRDGKTVNEEGYSTYLLADEAIRQLKQRDTKRPFFMDVAFNAPHVPLAAPEDLLAKHKTAGGVYAAVIEGMDIAIGRILAELDAQGLRENTIVLFYSDNGATRRESSNTPLRAGKGTVYEGGIRTPCIIRWPGQIPAGETIQQPVAGQDWLATLADAAGAKLPDNAKLDGSSQWPAIHSGKLVTRDPFLIAAYDIALIDAEWKLIEWADGEHCLINLRMDISETTDEFIRQPEVSRRLLAKLTQLKQGLPDAPPRRAAATP